MNDALKNVLRAIPQMTQRQDSETDQLRDLVVVANWLGMYDAADYLKVKALMDGCAKPAKPVNPPLAIGQVWEEVDPRLRRLVEVVAFIPEDGKVQIKCITSGKNGISRARTNRFNGRRGGYRFIRNIVDPAK